MNKQELVYTLTTICLILIVWNCFLTSAYYDLRDRLDGKANIKPEN